MDDRALAIEVDACFDQVKAGKIAMDIVCIIPELAKAL